VLYSPKRPAVKPPEWRGRTWTRSESSPSEDGLESERTCCLVFKDRSPLELVPLEPVAEPKKSLSEERPQSAREMRSLSVDSSSGSYPILQLPLGQRLSVAANLGFPKPLAGSSGPNPALHRPGTIAIAAGDRGRRAEGC
jgi:hypothetical protein